VDDDDARSRGFPYKQDIEACSTFKGPKFTNCKWAYKIKRNDNDQVERYCAILVVKGYAQKEDIDFSEIFSLVVRLITIRVALALCVVFKLYLEQFDVKTIFSWIP